MIVNLDCMQAVFLCSLLDKRLHKLSSEIRHYEERKWAVSYGTYLSKTSKYRFEIQKLASLRNILSKAIALNSMSDVLFDEFGIDLSVQYIVHDLSKYVVPDGDFDEDEFIY